jgi:hypothetical protein
MHKRCNQQVFNMGMPKCGLKCCAIQQFRSPINAYHKTIKGESV